MNKYTWQLIVFGIVIGSGNLFACPPPAGVTPGNLNNDDEVGFADFLILSANFGKTEISPGVPVGYADGDIDCSGDVGFADFLTLSANFTVPTTILDTESDVATVLVNGGFQDSTVYIFRKEATDDLNHPIDISGVNNSRFCFEGPLVDGKTVNIVACQNVEIIDLRAKDTVTYNSDVANDEFYDSFTGVVNVVGSIAVSLENVTIENTKGYNEYPQGTPVTTTLPGQSSCAVNIERSVVDIIGANLIAGGKSALTIHSNSVVTISDSHVKGTYFELNVAASTVTATNTVLEQRLFLANGAKDSHAAINTSVTPKRFDVDADNNGYIESNGETYTVSTNITMTDCTFEMQTGRPLVSGNGNLGTYPTIAPALVTLDDPTLAFAGSPEFNPYGLVGYNGNHVGSPNQWDSIKLVLKAGARGDVVTVFGGTSTERTYVTEVPIDNWLEDFITTLPGNSAFLDKGIGKFVHYQDLDASGMIAEPVVGNAAIPTGNLVSDGLDATDPTFNVNATN